MEVQEYKTPGDKEEGKAGRQAGREMGRWKERSLVYSGIIFRGVDRLIISCCCVLMSARRY